MTVVSDGLFMQGKTNEVLSSFFSFFGFWFYVKILDLYWVLLVLKSLYNLNKFSFKEKKLINIMVRKRLAVARMQLMNGILKMFVYIYLDFRSRIHQLIVCIFLSVIAFNDGFQAADQSYGMIYSQHI